MAENTVEWMDPDTAPKDGYPGKNPTKFLLGFADGHSVISSRGEDGRFYDPADGDVYNAYKPTGWAYLPTAPKKKIKAGAAPEAERKGLEGVKPAAWQNSEFPHDFISDSDRASAIGAGSVDAYRFDTPLYTSAPVLAGEAVEKVREALTKSTAELRELKKFLGPECDHDVNLCVCDMRRLIEENEEALGLLPTPKDTTKGEE